MKHTVEQLMTRNIFTIEDSSTLSEAKEMFDNFPIRHLPVTSHGSLIGMLSKSDVFRLCFDDTYRTEGNENGAVFDILKVEEVMTLNPTVIAPTDSIEKAASFFINKDYHALPVSDENGLVGIITTSDIIKYQSEKLRSSKVPEKYTEKRPWGEFEQFCQNVPCSVKIIHVKPNEELSLQYHEFRNEFWEIIEGEGVVVIGEDQRFVYKGDEFIIPIRTKHQIKTTYSPLVVLEIAFGHFDEKDIVRLKDKYKREKTRLLNS